MRKQVYCAAAVIVKDHMVLACERGYGPYKDGWEFPGGKIEPGESGKEAVVRELKEEMHYDIQPLRLLDTIACAYENFDLTLECWLCVPVQERYELLEHEDARWLKIEEMDSVNWLKADRILAESIRKGRVRLEKENSD